MNDKAISVQGLSKAYGEVQALKGVDFDVAAGTVFGLLGPNGAGKTTIVRIISTVLKPDGGRAEVMGHDVVRDAAEVRYRIGLAGQYAAVDPQLTGRENLRLIGRLAQMPRKMAVARADELLERFGLSDAASRPLRTYSGGMRRRLDVAAALVQKPPVLLMDEPTTGLDIQSRSELWEVTRELVAEGSTVLLTTQYLEEADQLADRIAVVDRGTVVANDTAAALKARLGSTTIELGMENEDLALSAERALADLFADHTEREGDKVRITSSQGPMALIDVLRSLEGQGLAPVGMSVREPTLDDAFLELTGRYCHADDLVHEGAICYGE
ncbi:MAG: ATP-binding cassette domain-containing protein [Actinobacteria bacterium]|nr:ATP-binding cassette domain-containing protein [Actinomycetota bacterium]